MHADLIELLTSRIGQDFDGECHLTEEEARDIIDVLASLSSPQEPVAWPVRIWDDEQKIFREPTDADMAARASPVVPVAAKAEADEEPHIRLTMAGDGLFYDEDGGEWEMTRATYEARTANCQCSDCVSRRATAAKAEAEGCPTVDDIRAMGWAVAVHNDYRLNGEPHTFWLFTKGDRAVKGEGRTDAEALAAVWAQLPVRYWDEGTKTFGSLPLRAAPTCEGEGT